MFLKSIGDELSKELQFTENMALGYQTSGSKLLDMNFRVTSYKNMSEAEAISDFTLAFAEDPIAAMRWLFFARDIRGGLGERTLFKSGLKALMNINPRLVREILPLVPVYGRWDDIFVFFDTPHENDLIKLIIAQLKADMKAYQKKEPFSLLAKWLPSINTSSQESRRLAHKITRKMGCKAIVYQKLLSRLRRALDVVEIKMSGQQWDKINYEHVPSKANLLYRNAFLKHDTKRRRKYLESVDKGEAKMHSTTNFPHDITVKYRGSHYRYSNASFDQSLELLWRNLEDAPDLENTLVVADGSGSMRAHIGKTSVQALDACNALAIYFAERCQGQFKNHYITFSTRPQLVNLGEGTLLSKLQIAESYNEVSTTNIEAVFRLILGTAIKNRMTQADMPKAILILSDMEFNGAVATNPTKALFDAIGDEYRARGYQLPKLYFWNLLSRTKTIPVQTNDAGVALISGFSPNTIKMALTGEIDPYKAMIAAISDERYDPVEEVVRKIL